jgi:hypothetical protein
VYIVGGTTLLLLFHSYYNKALRITHPFAKKEVARMIGVRVRGQSWLTQWEAKRSQEAHRRHMKSIKPVLCINPPLQRPRVRKETFFEEEKRRLVQRENGLLVQNIANTFSEGGYQRRLTNEFENMTSALDPGKVRTPV